MTPVAAQTVYGWIKEAQGERIAELWFWECTPMPCGLPSAEQLDEGLRVATGELAMRDLLRRVYAEMAALSAQYDDDEETAA